MCGIIGLLLANPDEHVNQLLFDGLTVLQHRGQDAAGIVTIDQQDRLRLRKDNGLVRDVFQQEHMLELKGHIGIGHVRYPTAGSSSQEEAQPFITNYPLGICVAHNGNLTNTDDLQSSLKYSNFRHVNTDSDSEVLLNVFAESLTNELLKAKTTTSTSSTTATTTTTSSSLSSSSSSMSSTSSLMMAATTTTATTPFRMQEVVFSAMETVMTSCQGGYAGVYLINGFGLVGFRDPHAIRPLVFGIRSSNNSNNNSCNEKTTTTVPEGTTDMPDSPRSIHAEDDLDYCIASESVALDTLGFKLVRDVRPGEAIFIDLQGNCHSKIVHANPSFTPCIFEYVYFARPDSIMDGVSVYEARLNMGEKLAEKILRLYGNNHGIDCVIPVPDTSRTSALQAAYQLDRPFREGFMKNRYIGRTFIMPGQEKRKKSVRLKLNTIRREFEGKNVLLVDDSIVRGTTAGEIVQMARDAGAKNVYFCSAAPPIRYPNIYGIDLPSQKELIAFGRTETEIAAKIGCEWVVYQDQADLEEAVRMAIPSDATVHPNFDGFDCSTFDGVYVTGQRLGDEYFTKLHSLRNDKAKTTRESSMKTQRSPSTLGGTDSPRMPKKIFEDVVVSSSTVPLPKEDVHDHAMRAFEKKCRIPMPTF